MLENVLYNVIRLIFHGTSLFCYTKRASSPPWAYCSNESTFMWNDNLPLQMVNHQQRFATWTSRALFLMMLSPQHVFARFSYSFPFPRNFIQSYRFYFPYCSKCSHVGKKMKKAKEETRILYNHKLTIIIKQTPFSRQEIEDIISSFCFHSNKKKKKPGRGQPPCSPRGPGIPNTLLGRHTTSDLKALSPGAFPNASLLFPPVAS